MTTLRNRFGNLAAPAISALAMAVAFMGAGLSAAGEPGAEPAAPPAPSVSAAAYPIWVSNGFSPAIVSIQSPEARRFTIEIESRLPTEYHPFGTGPRPGERRFVTRRRVRVEAGDSVNVEIPVPGGDARLRIPELQYNNRLEVYSRGGASQLRDHLLLVGGHGIGELHQAVDAAVRAAAGATPSRADTPALAALYAEQLPARWQSYAGLTGVPVFVPGDLRLLKPRQREALVRWVRWLGGRVWIRGAGAGEAAAAAGLAPDGGPLGEYAGARRFPCAAGEVWLREDDALPEVYNRPLPARGGVFATLNPTSPPAAMDWLFDPLTGLSAAAIAAMLLVFGLALGPANYLLIRRRRAPLLFFLTTPLLALAGSAIIFVLAIVWEGVSTKYTETLVLVQEEGAEDALLAAGRVVYSGLFTPAPEFAEDTLVAPFRQNEEENLSFTTELAAGQRLVSGWITPRAPSGLLSFAPVIPRLRAAVTVDGDRHAVHNGLTHAISRALVFIGEDRLGVVRDLPPGESREVEVHRRAAPGEAPPARVKEILDDFDLRWESFQQLLGLRPGRVRMLAECAGLPYGEDGDLSGSLVEGRYLYVLMAAPPRPQ